MTFTKTAALAIIASLISQTSFAVSDVNAEMKEATVGQKTGATIDSAVNATETVAVSASETVTTAATSVKIKAEKNVITSEARIFF